MKLPWFKATLITFLVLLFSFVTSSSIHGEVDPLTPEELDQINQQYQQVDQRMMNAGEVQRLLNQSKWDITEEQYSFLLGQGNLPWSVEPFTANLFLLTLHPLNLGISGAPQTIEGDVVVQTPGAIHLAGGLVSQVITRPPSSSVEYIADLGSKIGLAKPAYAQNGTGYQGLSGVLETWKIFRNISYALFVIIFVVVGFMIMFRSKLNPQTAVTLQLALPKLIITLLLITFSYAIAGFVIDMIYFLTYLAANILSLNPITFTGNNMKDMLDIFNPWIAGDTISNSLNNLFPQNSPLDVAAGVLTAGERLFGISLLKLIVGGAILFSVLKLLIQLVLAYVNIILQVIFAPIMLLFNALPAGNSFSSWIKNLIANAAAFPAVAIMIMVGSVLVTPGSGSSPDTLQLPFIGFLSGSQDFVQTIIGFGLIMLLPKVVTMIQEALKAKPAMPAGAAVIEGVGAAAAPLAGAWKARRETLQKRKESQLQAQQIGQYVKGP
mgnify:CR=1 FL=1